MQLFSHLFSSKQPVHFYSKQHRRLLRVLALCDLSETFINKLFFINFCVFERFFLEQMDSVVSNLGKWFSSLLLITWCMFWHCKIDEILTKLYFCICKKFLLFWTLSGPACYMFEFLIPDLSLYREADFKTFYSVHCFYSLLMSPNKCRKFKVIPDNCIPGTC